MLNKFFLELEIVFRQFIDKISINIEDIELAVVPNPGEIFVP